MFKVGDLVEVDTPFYWYGEDYDIGQRFVIEKQHVGHNFEDWARLVTQ